ncbi:MAG: cardiolipin synthase [Phycisphaeraceae bacterium]
MLTFVSMEASKGTGMSWWMIWTLSEWAIRLLMIPIILRRRMTPVTSLAWLAVVFLSPELGVVLYLLLGSNHLGRRRRRRHRRVVATMRSEARLAIQLAHAARPTIEIMHQPIVIQSEAIGGFNILGGNNVEFLDDQEGTINRLVQDIDAARHHVHILVYIFACDQTGRRIVEALCRASARGVTCRVLVDAAGSWGFFGRNGLAHQLAAANVRCLPVLPAAPLRRKLARLDLRNHRKLVVIDAKVAYSGSQNICDAEYGTRHLRWVDLMGRFTGPIVTQLQMVFLEDWAFETGEELDGEELLAPPMPTGQVSAQAVPTGPNYESQTLPRVILTALNVAQRKVIMTTPYLVPDEPTTLALAMALDRGVEVSLVVPRKGDHWLVAAAGRAYYEELLELGVQIYEFDRGLLHAKTMTVDDSFALLGSSNLDIRSFYLNFELNVLLYGPEITAKMRFAQMRYIAESTLLDRDTWAKRPMAQRAFERVAALGSPLL